MIDRKRRPAGAVRAVSLFAILALVFTSWQTVAASPTAQEAANGGLWSMGISARTVDDRGNFNHTVGAHFTVTTEDGEYIGECTLAEPPKTGAPWWNCRVDVPSDQISLVWEDPDSVPAGYAPVENPIAFDPTTYETGPHNIGVFFDNMPVDGGISPSSGTGQTSDVAIWTKENGAGAYDACYVLVDFSDVGCDENGDGKVTFMEVPVGTYTVHQTSDLGPNRFVPDFTIQVTGQMSADGWEPFTATIVTTGTDTPDPAIRGAGAPPAPASIDISLITRDPDDGHLLTGACYVLVGFSNEGCDENGDGQVTFDAIPAGTYTVHQTQMPAGYPAINDYDISVEPRFPDVRIGFIVKQAPKQNDSGTRNVSMVLVDSRTFTKVVSPICVQLADASEVGCDEDLVDGQVDFLDVQFGTHELAFSKLPSGWEILGGGQSGHSATIGSGTGPQIIYIAVYVPDGAGTSSSLSGPLDSSMVGMEWRDMVIGCDDPVACYGANIAVTRDSAPIGNCSITTNPNDTSHVHACSVSVPVGVTVTIHLDESTLAAGYRAAQNDIRFDTTDVGKRASHDFVFQIVAAETSSTSGASGSSGLVGSAQETWSAPVVAWICEDPAASVLDCRGEAGITVNISLASGELAGSCTTGAPTATPWGKASYCVVNDLPFNRDFVARQDPSTIPAGYVPAQESVELHVGSVSPVGFEDVAFAFRNNRDTATSTGSSRVSVSDSSAKATLQMTFRGCPEWFNPSTDDFFANCTIPLDAPDASIIVWGGDGQGGMSITALDRQHDGAYIYNAGPSTMHLQLSKMAPVVRDGYEVVGADGVNGDTYTVNLVDGETREVFVFYYFE
ncbi:MAG: prealbumin-like fold domain-containing protein [Thermomicrobiales bacterium]